MRRFLAVLSIVFMFHINAYAQLENIPLLNVTGESIITVEPDIAIISVKVERRISSNDLPGLNRNTLFQFADSQIRFVSVKDTSIYSTVPQLVRVEGNITFVKEFIITVHDISKLPDIVTDLFRRGFYNFTIQYRLLSISKVKQKARTAAIANARKNAVALASALGQTVGSAHLVTEEDIEIQNWYSHPLPVNNPEFLSDFYFYNPGFITVPARVKVSFDLKK